MKQCLTILLLLITSGLSYSQSAMKDYSEAIKLIEVWLDAQKDYDNLPGLSAAVINDQKLLWTGAVGMANVETSTKMNTSTICSICSISKLFTSIAVMQLYEQGKLRLDDHVSDLLPNYALKQRFPESGPVTVRSLLTHSSGLPREAAYPYWTGPDFDFPTEQEIDAKLHDQESLYPASKYFQYSNLGLTLLGNIVEEVSGIPYKDYVNQNIITPLGLSKTKTDLPEELYGKELAIGYSSIDRSGKREKVNFFQANGIAPAAGFSSTVLDLGKFASWQFRLRDSTISEILKPSTLKQMQNVHWTNPDWKTTWGLGFVVYKGTNGNTWVGHGGNCPGYRSTLQLDLKKKHAYAVMINANGASPAKYMNGIRDIINKVKAKKEKSATQGKKDFTDYMGYYSSQPWGSEVYASTWAGQLVIMRLPADKPVEAMTFYKHIEKDTFRRVRKDDELGETLTFERDVEGNVFRFQNHGNYSKKILATQSPR